MTSGLWAAATWFSTQPRYQTSTKTSQVQGFPQPIPKSYSCIQMVSRECQGLNTPVSAAQSPWLTSVRLCRSGYCFLVQISLKVLLQEFTWKGETGGDTSGNGRGTRCTNQNNAPDKDVNYALEKYGRNSRCLLQVNKFTMTLKLFIMTTYRPSPGRRSPAQC